MKKLLTFAFSLLLTGNVWAADNAVIVTPGTGLTLRSRDVGTGIQSLQQILGDTSGNALATAPGTPNAVFALPIQGVTGGTAVPISGSITIASGSTTVVQPTGTNLHAVIDSGTITAVTSLTNALPAGTNKIGTFDPATIATWGIAAASQNVAVPTNGQLVMGQFTTTPTTITTTNVSPLQLDNAGNLLVNIKAGAGSGGTAIADNAAFTQGTTNETPMGCYFLNGTYSPITAGHVGVVSCTNVGSLHTTVDNTNNNGSAVSANSSPVVIASDQVAVAIKAASGTIASGAIASGAVASGAFASGSIGSGAFAAGSFTNATAADACMFANKTNLAISQNGTSSVQLIALSGATVIYVCSLSLIAAGATTVALTTGTGTACVTGNAAVIGTTTTNIANSISLAANGGFTVGNGGGTIAKGAASSELCMILGTNVFVSGNLTYVQQL